MKVLNTAIEGVLILEPLVFEDERGLFIESFNQDAFNAAVGCATSFVQDNHARSTHGVLRGLHFQRAPHAQGKLVRVAHGAVFDVAVDLRRGSPDFGRWIGVELTGQNHRQLWLPPGLAHGYLVTGDGADVVYKTTGYRAPEAERCIRWNDPALAIAWPVLGRAPQLSTRDASAPMLADLTEGA